MKKTFIAVGVASLLGLTSVAQAAEFDWSGSIRAGYTSRDDGKGGDAVKKLGDSVGSRINLNASTDTGNGQSAGTELSYAVDGAAITVRRQNIWFSGGWGKLTLGSHGGIYRSAANWDGASYLGGNVRTEAGSAGGDTGIVYASNLGGPFSFDIELASVGDTKAVGRWATTAHYDFGAVTANFGYNALTINPDGYENNTAFSVNGAAGGFGYYLAYEISKHGSANKDAKTVGLFLSYDAGDNRFYVNYVSAKVDNEDNDPKETVLGYRYDLGAGVDFTAEYATVTNANDKDDFTGDDQKKLNLTLRYGF